MNFRSLELSTWRPSIHFWNFFLPRYIKYNFLIHPGVPHGQVTRLLGGVLPVVGELHPGVLHGQVTRLLGGVLPVVDELHPGVLHGQVIRLLGGVLYLWWVSSILGFPRDMLLDY